MKERLGYWIFRLTKEYVKGKVIDELVKEGKVLVDQAELDRMISSAANIGYERGKYDGIRETEERYLVGYWGKRKLEERMKEDGEKNSVLGK